MRFVLSQLILGLTTGAIFALIALGYTLVYGIIELINFAHGDVFTVGALIGLSFIGLFGLEQLPPVLLVPAVIALFAVTMSLNGLVGVVIERVAYRPLRNAPRLAALITAVGVSFVLEGIIFLIKGPSEIHYPNLLPSNVVDVGGLNIGVNALFIIAIAVLLMIGLQQFIQRTRIGRAMRATAQDRDAARLMGININTTIAITFFIGSALAAAGGIIYGFYFQTVRFDLGFENGLIAFTAAVFGGIGNVIGAALGGFIIGIILAFTGGLIPGGQQWADIFVFSILILVLVFRPTGLLGMRVPEK